MGYPTVQQCILSAKQKHGLDEDSARPDFGDGISWYPGVVRDPVEKRLTSYNVDATLLYYTVHVSIFLAYTQSLRWLLRMMQ